MVKLFDKYRKAKSQRVFNKNRELSNKKDQKARLYSIHL